MIELHRRTLGAAAFIAVLIFFWLAPFGTPRAALPTAGQRILAFGDSLVEGVGATEGRDFVTLLSRRLGVTIANVGLRGDTTASALARLEPAVLARDPRIVIVLLGGNDYIRRVPTRETFDNLRTIVTRIRARGAAVVLVGVSVGLIGDPYGSEYEELARETSSGLIPDILGGIFGRPSLMSDGIHPNDRGYEMIADRLEPALRELMR